MPLDESSTVEQVAKLKLPDGSLVMPDGSVIRPNQAIQPAVSAGREIQNGRAASRTLERVHRKLGDLPECDGKKLNAVAAVLAYTQVGLANSDIAIIVGASVEAIEELKELDAYKQLSDMFDSNLFDDAKRSAAHIIAQASAKAANKMVDFIDSPNDQIAVVASREVMKANGISTEHTEAKNKSGLHIKIVRKGDRRAEETIVVEL